MKFLLDENIPPSLATKLKEVGYETRHVFDIGLNASPDFSIADFAASNDEVIITHDTDFGTILALTGHIRPSVILFRWQKTTIETLFLFLKAHLPALATPLEAGSLIVVDEDKIRVRSLPLKR